MGRPSNKSVVVENPEGEATTLDTERDKLIFELSKLFRAEVLAPYPLQLLRDLYTQHVGPMTWLLPDQILPNPDPDPGAPIDQKTIVSLPKTIVSK